MDPAKVVLQDDGLFLILERTKVIGPGKRVGNMVAVIARGAYYQEKLWLGACRWRGLFGRAPGVRQI